MGFKFSRPLKYGTKKKHQNAMKQIMSGKKKLAQKDSIHRVNKVYNDTLKQVSPTKKTISPTARLNNTFGSKKVIK